MSAIAGLFLMLYGAGAAYLGVMEIMHPDQLTKIAAYSTAGIGAALLVVGIGHFIAPHKSFLLAIPLLAYFHVQNCVNTVFYLEQPRWGAQIVFAFVSLLILYISYRGYKNKSAAVRAA